MNKKSAVYLLLPAFLAVLVFTFYPLIQIAIPTLNTKQGFLRLYTQFLKSTYNWEVIQRTFIIAIITMLIGVINQTLMALHIAKSPVSILYTDTSIIVGSAYLFLPIMITSLVGSVSELNIETEEAAAVLGANPWTSLFKIIIPQLTTGIFTGSILVFAGTMTAYTTPQILGGNRHLVMSTLIYQQAMTLGNWDNASAIAIVLILISALSMTILRLIGKKLDRRPGLA